MKIRYDMKPALDMLHIKTLRKHQVKPIYTLLNAQDTLVIAPTGSGKSAIYQLPAIMHSDRPTLVIEPTIALMHDQVRKLTLCGIAAAYLDSTMSQKEQLAVLKQFISGKVNILYLTPERLTSESFLYVLQNVQLYMVVVDECHCVLDWGCSFRSAYLHIGHTIDNLPHRPIVAAFTATACNKDIGDIANLLHMNHPAVYQQDLYRKNLIYIKKYAESRKHKQKLLIKHLHKYHRNASVIYCNTKHAVDAVYELLQKKYPNQVVKCHSGMSPKQRSKHEVQFLSGEKSIMVATTAFGMGVDMGTIDLVIHFNMPLSLTDYMQQSGRAGRDGRTAHCVLLYSDDDYYTNKVLLEHTETAGHSERMLERLDEMKEYCDDKQECQQKRLLRAFDNHHLKSCNRCSNCQKNRRK